jgi:hypothetical protein
MIEAKSTNDTANIDSLRKLHRPKARGTGNLGMKALSWPKNVVCESCLIPTAPKLRTRFRGYTLSRRRVVSKDGLQCGGVSPGPCPPTTPRSWRLAEIQYLWRSDRGIRCSVYIKPWGPSFCTETRLERIVGMLVSNSTGCMHGPF